MTKTNDLTLKLVGKRNGNLVTPYSPATIVLQSTVRPGHIIKIQDNYLECIGFQSDEQPRFKNVTLDFDRAVSAQEEIDYADTLRGFRMGAGQW